MSQGLWEQLCLLFLPAGVLATLTTSALAHLGGGQCPSGGWKVGWSTPGEDGQQRETAGVERNLAREKEEE